MENGLRKAIILKKKTRAIFPSIDFLKSKNEWKEDEQRWEWKQGWLNLNHSGSATSVNQNAE